MIHWLAFNNLGAIVGCVCGYRSTAALDAYDWGDNVVLHIQAEAWDHAIDETAQQGTIQIPTNPYRSR